MILAIASTGCAALRPQADLQSVSDSRVVEKSRIVTRYEIVSVPVTLEIPKIREIRRNVKDSTDVIENDFSISSVTVHSDGTFDHSLETKPQAWGKTVEVPVQSTDSSFFREASDEESEREVEIRPVETNVLKCWQKILVWTGAAALILMAGSAVKLIFKHNLNTIPMLFKQLFKGK